jgi:hypothetical protein
MHDSVEILNKKKIDNDINLFILFIVGGNDYS